MAVSWIQIVIVVALLILLFGRGRISALMGDLAKGIKSFRRGMQDDDARSDARPQARQRKALPPAKADKPAAKGARGKPARARRRTGKRA